LNAGGYFDVEDSILRVGFVTDLHYGGYNFVDLTSPERATLAVEKLSGRNLDCVVYVGDNVSDNSSLLPAMKEISDAHNCPVRYVHGGHDICDNATWNTLFGYDKNYSFVLGSYAFVVLDNWTDTSGGFTYWEESPVSDVWLTTELDKYSGSDGIFIVTHYISEAISGSNLDIIVANPKILAVLYGHGHNFINTAIVGKPFIQCGHWSVCPGGIWDNAIPYNFGLLEININGTDINIKQVVPAYEYPGFSQPEEVRQTFVIR